MIGNTFGNYSIISTLGKGAMGIVYLAKDPQGREVALKLILEEALKQVGNPEIIKKRFQREAKFTIKLQHPNIVRTLDAGEVDGALYLACEVMRGISLDQVIKNSAPLSQNYAIKLLRHLLRGLEEIHRHNIVHRDIKPANVLMDEAGTAKLADFGLVRSTTEDRTILTQPGQIMGTPFYISPEQIQGEETLDIRTDLYAVGAIFYQALSGKAPFTGATLLDILKKHLQQPLEPLMNDKVDEQLKQIIYSLLQKDRSRRPATPSAVLEELDSIYGPGVETFSDSTPTLGGDTIHDAADHTFSDVGTFLQDAELIPVPQPGKGVSRVKLSISKDGQFKTLFVYAGNNLQIGRNAIDIDQQDICLRLRPVRSNEESIRQISGKHLQLIVEQDKAYIVDLGSRGGTEFNSKMLAGNVRQELLANNTVRVARVIELEMQSLIGRSTFSKLRGVGDIVRNKPSLFIRRLSNCPEHSYALVSGILSLTVSANGDLQPHSSGSIEILNIDNHLWYCGADLESKQCALLIPGKNLSIKGFEISVSDIQPQDQK